VTVRCLRICRFVPLRRDISLCSQTTCGKLVLTSEISHARPVYWNLIYAGLVIDVITISLESGDHLLRTFDTWTWHFGWCRRLLSAVGVDDLTLMGRHVHVLLTVAAGNPTAHICQSLISRLPALSIGQTLTQWHRCILHKPPGQGLCSSQAFRMAFLAQWRTQQSLPC